VKISGTAAEEATGGKTQQTQEKKPWLWNGNVNLELSI